MGFIIRSSMGEVLANINTGMKAPVVINGRSDRELLTFEIERVPFLPGTYVVDLSVAMKSSGRLDFVESALEVSVMESDVYKTGYQPTSRDGVIYLDGSFRLEAANHSPDS